MYCEKCGSELKGNQTVCENCSGVDAKKEEKQELGMKWYKFNVYFSLFFIGALSVLSGVLDIMQMKIDTAVLWFIYGVFAIIVRVRLSGYKKDAPMMIVCLNVIYAITQGYSALVYEANSAFALGIVLAILNYVYFKKRKNLFVK